jgi:glycerophosphoryl diester phosphodiesterase
LQQGADYVEQDLQVTKDGVLICSHDADLARTTNVEEVYPDRATERDPAGVGAPRRGWFAVDFTLAEIERLDAGSWFNRANPFQARDEYAGQRIPTLDEAIREVKSRAGLYIETKHVAFYRLMGHDMVGKLVETLDRHRLSGTDDSGTPVLIQSFSKSSLLELGRLAPKYRRVQLLPMEDPGRTADTSKVTAPLAREIRGYAFGAGPDKSMITSATDVDLFHAEGVQVHPYTFRGSTSAVLRRPLDQPESGGATLRRSMIADMRRYIGFGIDGGFTDYPDLWQEAVQPPSDRDE